MVSYSDCTSVSNECPVVQTVYGYTPSLGANAFFLAWFALFAMIQSYQAVCYRAWVFSTFMIVGCLGEAIGYVGRILLHDNPWSNDGFEIQISTLIFSPAFFAAAFYLTLKHIVRNTCPKLSRIPPSAYTWIFISCDIVSLVLQAAGGGTAAAATTDTMTNLGGHIMLAGIVFQVATLTALIALVVDYVLRVNKHREVISAEAKAMTNEKSFKHFIFLMGLGFLGIYIRCVYRIAELAGGWANPIMRSEVDFIVLDGV